MAMQEALWVKLLTVLVAWVQENPEEVGDKIELLEACRECLRSVLGVCGVHRATEVIAEGWQLLTAFKCHCGGDAAALFGSVPVPISSAAPSLICQPLKDLARVGHVDILEEELASTLDWVLSMTNFHHGNDQEIFIWLRDLKFILEAAHFSLVRRSHS